MSKLYFCNENRFNITAMLTLGVSVKESDEAVGFFGTGFKYAVAIVLRNGGSMTIQTDGEEYVFSAVETDVRGKTFNVVYVNGQSAGFTTHLGANWEPWMAFRELYCNATDEGGDVYTEQTLPNKSFDTKIVVDCPAVFQAYENYDEYFVNAKPICSSNGVDFHPGNKNHIFYKGIAAGTARPDELFSYNMQFKTTLTEDRTIKDLFLMSIRIGNAVAECTNTDVLREIFNNPRCAEIEQHLALVGNGCEPSKEFMFLCEEYMNTDLGLPEPARLIYLRKMPVKTTWPSIALSPVQTKMLAKAILFLDNIHVDLERFPINTVSGLGAGVMGRAYEGEIYISEMPFQMGTKQLTSTLLEEWVHCKYGCNDFDREMQNWLFDKILSLAEEFNGEPL